MQIKPIIPREEAERDVDDVLSYYLHENAPEAAHGFIDALESAYHHISQFPGTGSPRYANKLNLPEIRHWSLGNYPYLILRWRLSSLSKVKQRTWIKAALCTALYAQEYR